MEGKSPEVEDASIRACRLNPVPEMRTTILGGDGDTVAGADVMADMEQEEQKGDENEVSDG